MNTYYVYICTNNSETLYIGVTNNLERRMEEHRSGGVPGFNQKYKVNKLLFFEQTSNINDAIAREKQLKNWHREWKLNLIRTQNPDFHDLYEKTLKQVQGDNLW